MRKMRFLAIIAAGAVMFCFAGCQKEDNSVGQSEPTSGEVAEIKTIEPPEDGWTLDKLLDVTYLYSHQLKNPCTLNTLGSDFNFDNEFFSLHKEDNGASVMLQYKGTTIASVGLKDCRDQDTVSNDTEIYRMFFTLLYGDDNINNVAVNGITFYSSKEDVISRLGMPDVDVGHTVTYYKPNTEESLLSLGINEDNEVKSIHITLTGQPEPTSVEPAKIKTIEPPEDGWTLEQLNDVLYMNGQKIEVPLMFSTLKEGYEIREKTYYDDTDRQSGWLYYNNQFIAIAAFYESEDDYNIVNLTFPPAHYEDDQDYSDYIIINGFGLDTGASNVPKYLGNGFTSKSGFYVYVIGDNEYTILVSDYEHDYMIMLFEGVNNTD